ncbi:Integrase catalytic domain-containing protein [Mycena venus]|uniref:Integrase catalytic domain-containing protein n=1 Tax=Mycena venus TaxID=2733690 RepID=A0A8H7DHH7_9AGAR|nr:Integrase catalytic domain-containing protein [Mycena venus]
MNANNDPVHTFLMEAHNICVQAQFIVDSLPNAEIPAVERSTHQLGAVRRVVAVIDDPAITEDIRETLIADVDKLLSPLEDFLANPPPPPGASLPRVHTGLPGRPRYSLDLQRALLLHDLGNSWTDISHAMGVDRKTLYRQFEVAGISTARREFTDITDNALDEIVAEISLSHPWAGIIKRRVYKVRGSNALWHHDGNEKLRPWGFYVHGCIDGHSRLIIYLACRSNKRKATVAELFQAAVAIFGWPSRMRGDFGTENNEVERLMIAFWGIPHRAYLRGRSRHNVRIERLWRDVRKDALEAFRQIFDYLEKSELLDMENPIHSTCFRTAAITRGYWTGDPGDNVNAVASDPLYGFDGEAPLPPAATSDNEPLERTEQPVGTAAERENGILVNGDEDLLAAKELLGNFDCDRDDGNWGIEVYCEAVVRMTSQLNDNLY